MTRSTTPPTRINKTCPGAPLRIVNKSITQRNIFDGDVLFLFPEAPKTPKYPDAPKKRQRLLEVESVTQRQRFGREARCLFPKTPKCPDAPKKRKCLAYCSLTHEHLDNVRNCMFNMVRFNELDNIAEFRRGTAPNDFS